MANSRGKIPTTLLGASAGDNFKDVAVMTDGTQFGAGWEQKLAAEGRILVIHGGTLTTPITGAGVYVSTTPDLDVKIPAGVLAVPLFLQVNYETVGTSGIQECFAIAGVGGTFATGGTSVTPVNARLDLSNTWGITAQSPASSAVLPTGNIEEFFRNSPPMGITKTSQSATVSSIDPYRMVWSARESGLFPHCYSTTTHTRINVWMGGQAPTGFITLVLAIPQIS